MTAVLACPHTLKPDAGVHYCRYIGVPDLVGLLGSAADTTPDTPHMLDGLLRRAGLMAAELWLEVMRKDAELMAADLADPTATPEKLWAALKLARRGVVVGRLLSVQASLMLNELRQGVTMPTITAARQPTPALDSVMVGVMTLRQTVAALPGADADTAAMLRQLSAELETWDGLMYAARAEYASLYLPDLDTHHAELLALSRGALVSDWPDELMFIIVHQASELWFHVLIRQLRAAITTLNAQPQRAWQAAEAVRRAANIQGFLAQQIQVPLTMFPGDFLQFRGRLDQSSGLESYQFREVELVSGLRDPIHQRHITMMGKNADLFVSLLQESLDGQSLAQAFRSYIRQRGLIAPDSQTPDAIAADLRDLYARSSRAANPNVDVFELGEQLVQYERQMQLWRDAHIGMVAQMIGTKAGTGDSAGVAYLRQTMSYAPLFPELWQVRTLLPAFAG